MFHNFEDKRVICYRPFYDLIRRLTINKRNIIIKSIYIYILFYICRSFLSCRSSFPPCGWQGEIYFWRETSSRIRTRHRCATRLHAGAGASAHVLYHTATPTQHSTPTTQANNRKLATTPKNTPHPKTHHTTQSKHHEQQAYPYYNVNINSIRGSQTTRIHNTNQLS